MNRGRIEPAFVGSVWPFGSIAIFVVRRLLSG